MEPIVLEIGKLWLFAGGVVAVLCLYWSVGLVRLREASARGFLSDVVNSKTQYALAGLLLGIALGTDSPFHAGTVIVQLFFAGWFGLLAGCAFDLRVVSRVTLNHLLGEGIQAGVLVAVVLFVLLVPLRLEGLGGVDFSVPLVCLLCAACVVNFGWSTEVSSSGRYSGRWRPSMFSFAAIALGGLGSTWLRGGSFHIYYPFDQDGRSLLVEGLFDESLYSIVFGAILGVVLNLISKGVTSDRILVLSAGMILLGCGVASGFGLEPLWVGFVSGGWFINSTLRRIDVVRVFAVGRSPLKSGLLFLIGWLVGGGLVQHSLHSGAFLGILALLLVLRPFGQLTGMRAATHLLGPGWRKWDESTVTELVRLDELTLVISLSLFQALAPRVGLSVLAAALLAYCVAQIWAPWLSTVTSRFRVAGS